jgi:putative CocE/NonD family hydrolase
MNIASASTAELVTDGVLVHRDLMVEMRDGIRLATDVYVPEGQKGPFPVILERTPYGKAERSRSEIEIGMRQPMTRAEVAGHFVKAGFAVVYQDCRGRYGSEGDFVKYLSEGEDGYDAMAWLAGESWCNGRVGTMGLSYAAHTQMALACLNPPGLSAMVVDSGGFASAFRCGIRQGGAFELKQATWAYNQARESREAREDPKLLAALEAEDLVAWFGAMPWRRGVSPVRWVPEYEDYLLDQWRSGTFDDSWRKVGIYAEGSWPTFPDVPIAFMSSWYDAYVSSTLDNYRGLSGPGRMPPKLIMGAGLHGNRNQTFAGDASFGDGASLGGHVAESWLDFRRRWFDRWLKDEPNGVEAEPRVRLFLMGGGTGARTAENRIDVGGRWIEAADWPLPGTRTVPYHIHPDGLLAPEAPPAGASPFVYDFDPANPVPTIGGALTSGQPVFEGGVFDQRESDRFLNCRRPGLPLSARLDVLAFETPPLDEDTAIVGPIVAELWVASDAPDTDFTVKLVDVHPPSADYPTGNALLLTDGILRCRYRKSFEAPEPIAPGEIFLARIECFATANLFKAGHRIRIEISSSNFPKFDVNPNTGAPEGEGLTRRVARNTVFCDASRPSRILLPIADPAALTPLRPSSA